MVKKQIDLFGREISSENIRKTELKIKKNLLNTPDYQAFLISNFHELSRSSSRSSSSLIESILLLIDFDIISLKEVNNLFDIFEDTDEILELFIAIVDICDISKQLSNLFLILEHFPKEEWDIEYDRCEAFEYLYDAVLKSGLMMENFPKFILILERFKYNFGEYRLFSLMLSRIQDTKVFKKHLSLIKSKFNKLLDKYHQYSKYPGYSKDFTKQHGLYPSLTDIASYLMQDGNGMVIAHNKPDFSRFFKLISDKVGPISDILSDNTHLLALYVLLEGEMVSARQYDELFWLLERSLDRFSEIYKDRDLSNTFNIFFDSLITKMPDRTKQVLSQKSNQLITNISLLKEQFPKKFAKTHGTLTFNGHIEFEVSGIPQSRRDRLKKPTYDREKINQILSKLVKIIPYYYYWVFLEEGQKQNLSMLLGLLEGKILMTDQYSNLKWILEGILGNLYKIEKEEELLKFVSLFVQAFMKYDSAYIEKIFKIGISRANQNLSALKKLSLKAIFFV